MNCIYIYSYIRITILSYNCFIIFLICLFLISQQIYGLNMYVKNVRIYNLADLEYLLQTIGQLDLH